MTDNTLTWWAPWALPIVGDPIRNALIIVVDGKITSVQGSVSRDDASAQGAELFHDCVLTPGFVNAHSHLEYAAYDTVTDGLSFDAWIADHMHRKRRLNDDHVSASALFGAWQSVASGITYTADASFSGDAARAVAKVGMRSRIYLEVFGGRNDAVQVLENAEKRLADLPTSERIEYGISPHAPYTVFPDLYRTVAESGHRWMTHIAESAAEQQYLRDGDGPMVVAFSERGFDLPEWSSDPLIELNDVLNERAIVVHGVNLTDGDVEALATAGTALVHCPRSNARLGCGMPDLARLQRAGVVVVLGTDSPASAGPIDMFAEMRSAIELNRAASRDATALSTLDVLKMCTVTAAQALGHDDLGVLLPGAPADITVTRIGVTNQPVQRLVLGATSNDVQAVCVAGRIVWRSGNRELSEAREAVNEAIQLLELPVAIGLHA